MKGIAVLLLSIIIALSAPLATPVYAAGASYARAAVRDAYFFSEKNLSSSLFAVPYTYCVEVLRDDGDWYYVRYANDTGLYKALYGYCRKQDFTTVEGTPQVTYLYKTVTVTYKTDGGTTSLPVLNEIAVEAAFYGTYYSGATAYSYVFCQGSFGYIAGANDDYPLNIEEGDDGKDEPKEDGETKGVNAGLITAIIICALAAAAFVMLYFTTRKKRTDG